MTWVGLARSNYFRVKDTHAFLAALEPFEETVSTVEDKGIADKGICLMALVNHGWERCDLLLPLVAAHLQEGHVAVFVEGGFNRRSYATGHAVAVNGNGETRSVDLADIYTLARELGDHVTAAEY